MRILSKVLIFLFVLSVPSLYAEETVQNTYGVNTNTIQHEVPEGMEAISVGGGGGQLIVPKGAKTRKVGAQIIVEGTKEYMSRMVQEMSIRLDEMEKKQEELLAEIETLKKMIEEMKKK